MFPFCTEANWMLGDPSTAWLPSCTSSSCQDRFGVDGEQSVPGLLAPITFQPLKLQSNSTSVSQSEHTGVTEVDSYCWCEIASLQRCFENTRKVSGTLAKSQCLTEIYFLVKKERYGNTWTFGGMSTGLDMYAYHGYRVRKQLRTSEIEINA